MIRSEILMGDKVAFPAFAAQREYMVPFTLRGGLPSRLRRWSATVDAMLSGISADGTMYLMIDQRRLLPGDFHRRPGVHVDGNWIAKTELHRQPEPYQPPGHGHPPQPYGPRHVHASFHGHRIDYAPELLLLASNVSACRAFVGEFVGTPNHEGDCSHFDLSGATEVMLDANRVYRATATTLHESLPVEAACERTLVRINIPL